MTTPRRRWLPRSLLGRSLLIILIPLVLVQGVVWQVFYRSHLDILSRRLSMAVAGEIGGVVALLDRFPGAADRGWIFRGAWEQSELALRLDPPANFAGDRRRGLVGVVERSFNIAMTERVGLPYTVEWGSDPGPVIVTVQMSDAVLRIEVPRKRLFTLPIYLFVVFLVGSAGLLGAVAVFFMRRQVRGIERLAAAAEAFGRGQDVAPLRPEGATEVRAAAIAFNAMQDRVQRFLRQRTEMLAGVSHDLRTPLTRLRLSLALLPVDPKTEADITDMTADLAEMDRMIGGYLDFVRGVGQEPREPADMVEILSAAARQARRSGAEVEFAADEPLVLSLRPEAMRRAITNLIDNARRHGRRIQLTATRPSAELVAVTVEDDGPGIRTDRREDVFRPFATGAHGGTGLGLTIARDIVRAHGGDISLHDSALGGLCARITLPA
ncbi:MAG: HAMP domain-containing protein [Acetobacteraceae bacterium]|nr:HAMP domain-containing protein [Acetobacteraceae bacterium]